MLEIEELFFATIGVEDVLPFAVRQHVPMVGGRGRHFVAEGSGDGSAKVRKPEIGDVGRV